MSSLAFRCPVAHSDRVVLDTRDWPKAIGAAPLRVAYIGTGPVPAVTIDGPDGAIELVGEQEILRATDALVSCNRLASGFGLPVPVSRWRRMQEDT